MSFNKPSMNGLNNFDVAEIETLITNNTNAIINKQDEITSSNRLSATLIGNNGWVSNQEFGYLRNVTSNIQYQFNDISDAIEINNQKVGITTQQSDAIEANSLKIGLTQTQIDNIAANTLKTGLTQTQIDNIAANTLKIGLTQTQIDNITANNQKIGITTQQSGAIEANTADILNKQNKITTNERLSATLIGDNGNVSNTEYGFLQGVTSDIQDQLTFNAQATTQNTAKTTDMTYDSGNTKTTFANDVHVSQSLSTAFFPNVNATLYSYGQAIALNTDKIGITTSQATAITNNSASITINSASITDIDAKIQRFSTVTGTTTLNDKFVITNNNEPQFSIISGSGSSGDATMRISGRRTGSQQHRHAKIDLQNDDSQVTPSVGNMCSIVGRVTNHGTNVGGLEIVNYTDGQTPTSALTMSYDGNFLIGGGTTFKDEDDCKLNIVGKLRVSSSIYQIPQMVIYNFDKTVVSNNFWGDGNVQTDLVSTRTAGTAFSSFSNGTITFTESGTYKIKATGNLQSIGQNDRLAFAIYLALINSETSTTTDYFQDENYNFFSWLYTRNITDGAHGNVNFEDYLYITSGESIEIRNKLDINNTSYDDTMAESRLNLYSNVEITKITDAETF